MRNVLFLFLLANAAVLVAFHSITRGDARSMMDSPGDAAVDAASARLSTTRATEPPSATVSILFWSTLHTSDLSHRDDEFILSTEGLCRLSYKRTADWAQHDALVMHFSDICGPQFVPPMRPPRQSWVLYRQETVYSLREVESHCKFAEWSGVEHMESMFNVSMDYRLSSAAAAATAAAAAAETETAATHHVPVPNLPCTPPFGLPRMSFAEKTRLHGNAVAWVATYCDARNNRLEYVQELARHIQVDSYGPCFHTKDFPNNCTAACGRNAIACDDPFTAVLAEYKFYLSFENALCDDYVTEKFWRSLHLGIIPVVMGPRNMSNFRPATTSIIDVRDFASPRQLAAFLHAVGSDEPAYQQFHAWKANHSLVRSEFARHWLEPQAAENYAHVDAMVRLCAVLHRTRRSNLSHTLEQDTSCDSDQSIALQ